MIPGHDSRRPGRTSRHGRLTRVLSRPILGVLLGGIVLPGVAWWSTVAHAATLATEPAAALCTLCVLNPTGSSLQVSGNGQVLVHWGAVVVDSSDAAAVQLAGNAVVQSSESEVVGGLTLSGNPTASPTFAQIPAPGDPDPFTALTAPTPGSSVAGFQASGHQTVTASPGTYSTFQVAGQAAVTLSPGVYVITQGFQVSGQASVTGSGVTLFFAGHAAMDLTGGSTVHLTAPASGPFAGISVFYDRGDTAQLQSDGNATPGQRFFGGAIYAAAGELGGAGAQELQVDDPVVVGSVDLAGGGTLLIDNVQAGKSVTGASLAPHLGLTLAPSEQSAIPGDTVWYAATVTNTGATLTLTGQVTAANPDTTVATVAAYSDTLQTASTGTCSSGSNHGETAAGWSDLAGTGAAASGYTPLQGPLATGMTLTFTPQPATGVTYPASGDPMLGTQVQPGDTATWGYTATIPLTSAQETALLDPSKVAQTRNSFHVEVLPDGQTEGAGQQDTVNSDFCQLFQAGVSGDVTSVSVTVTPPSGAAVTLGPNQDSALASLAPGASATERVPYVVPVVAAKGASETDSVYLARLQGVEGSTLSASATASGTTYSGPVSAPAATAAVTEHLPIVGITKSGPVQAMAGTTATYPLALQNGGGATAQDLVITDSLPDGSSGTVSGTPTTLAPGATGSATATYAIPGNQPAGGLTDTASVTWGDANGDLYGPVSSMYTTQVEAATATGLSLAPSTAGPDPVGGEQTLTATLTDSTGAPVANQTVSLAVSGVNPTTQTATTDSGGHAVFTYSGANAGVDAAQATFTQGSLTLQSNTATITWVTPAATVSSTPVTGNFYAVPSSASTFVAQPGDTPAFGQSFPTLDFNPPAGVVPDTPAGVDPTTRPFTDVTTDEAGVADGTIVAQGNGIQAGVGPLSQFDAAFTADFVVAKPGDVTFNIIADDGFLLGVGGGASRVNGTYENPPASNQSPFQGYQLVAAYNQSGGSGPSTYPVTVHFPQAGTYPYELDYFECCGGGLSLTMTVATFTAHTSPLTVYVGYADGLRPAGSVFPYPWDGSPGVNFIGCGCTYDAGALRFDNSSAAPIGLDSVTVDIGGNHFDIWPHSLTVPAGQTLILSETSNDNFDTSDFSGTGCGTDDGVIPQVHVTIGGVTTTYADTGQILNTFGYDLACRGNESQAWQSIGGGGTPINVPLPPAASLGLRPVSATDTVGSQQTETATLLDASGSPLAGVAVELNVYGANPDRVSLPTDSQGVVEIPYAGLNAGTDTVWATAFIDGMQEVSNQAAITWVIPVPGGGSSGGSPQQAPPAIASPSPADGTLITTPTPITAAITPPSGETITQWAVTATAASTGAVTHVASGTGTPPAPPTALGTFDPTLLPDDSYTISFSATASGGGTQTVTSTVDVSGNLKPGRYVSTYQDLSLPVNGLPVAVQRIYDSYDTAAGDFGVGWRLGLSDFTVSANRELGAGGWTEYATSCFILCSYGYKTSAAHYVTITFPDHHQDVFNFTPTGPQLTLIDIQQGTAAFTEASGRDAGATLSVTDPTQQGFYPGWDGNLYTDSSESSLYNPTRFTLTLANGTSYVLDEQLGMVSESDPNGNTVTVDSSGVHLTLGPASSPTPGPSITVSRDPSHGNRITEVAGPDDGVNGEDEHLTYGYNSAGQLVSVTDPEGNTVTYAYDSTTGLLLGSTDPNGQPIQTVTYGPDGRLQSIANGSQPPTTITTEPGDEQQVVADPNGKLSTVITYDVLGDVIEKDQTFNGNTLTTKLTYDSDGRVTSETAADGYTRTWVYDASGHLQSYTDGGGNNWQFENYNALGQPQTVVAPGGAVYQTYSYFTSGLLQSAQLPGESPTTYAYYSNGKLKSVTDPAGRTLTYTYNAAGFLTSETDGAGHTTSYVPDASGNVLSVTDPDGNITRYTYDGSGLLTAETDGAGVTDTYTYDAQGDLVAAATPAGTTTYSYQSIGLVSKRTDSDGQVSKYAYDGDGNLTQETLPGGVTQNYRYDPLGELVEADNSSGELNFSYDAAGDLATQTSCSPQLEGAPCPANTATASEPTATVTYAWYPSGLEKSVTEPGGTTGYQYQGDELASVVDAAGNQFNYTPTAQSEVGSLDLPNGVTQSFTYDPAGLPTSDTAGSGGNTIAGGTYGLSSTTAQRDTVTSPTGTAAYAYLPNGWLQSETQPSGSGLPTQTFTYDGAGNLTSWGAAPPGSVNYDSDGRLVQAGTLTYTYDNEGDLLSKIDTSTGAATHYAWNADHQLLAITYPDGSQSQYQYDPLGRRISVDDNGTVTRYVYDGYNVAAEYDSQNALTAAYTLTPTFGAEADPGKPALALEAVRGGVPSYFVDDASGSTVATTNASGSLTGQYAYSAYGLPAASNGPETAYTYAGAQYDPSSGLYYMRDRYYDPSTARFISQDPVAARYVEPQLGEWARRLPNATPAIPESEQRYVYAGADPVNFSDPSGDISAAQVRNCALAVATVITMALGPTAEYKGGEPVKAMIQCVEQMAENVAKSEYYSDQVASDVEAWAAEADVPAEVIGDEAVGDFVTEYVFYAEITITEESIEIRIGFAVFG